MTVEINNYFLNTDEKVSGHIYRINKKVSIYKIYEKYYDKRIHNCNSIILSFSYHDTITKTVIYTLIN